MEYAIEVTYRRGKQAARSRGGRWTQAERQLLAQKTHKLLRQIRTTGLPDGVDPVHSKTGLPRISSQAGYAAVYDKFVEMGINLDSPFDSIYEAIERKAELSSVERRELIRRVEKIEAQLRKGANADESVIVGDILAIQAVAPDICSLLIEVLADPRAEFGDVAKGVIGQVHAAGV
jgi:adenosylmethionine-8-amino-7-oxononanoate aminotransferase